MAEVSTTLVGYGDQQAQWMRLAPRARPDGGVEWGYPVIGNRRKVIAWSAAPWSDVHVVDTGAAKGRLVSAVTVGGGVAVTVVAVCIPWAAAHVSSGRRDRARWDDHVEFCATLGDLPLQVQVVTASVDV